MTFISIVITTYHRPEQIARAIKCAECQTAPHEIIVVDDNGRDTPEQQATAEQILPFSDRVSYLVNEVNHGPSYSRNRGLEQARGDYITFLDDDDEIAPEKLEAQAALLDQKGPEYSSCYCSFTKYLAGGKRFLNAEKTEGEVYPYILGRMLYVGSGSNLLVRTGILKDTGGYEESMRKFEDYEMMGRILKHHRLAYLDQNLLTIHYEVREKAPTYQELVSYDQLYFDKIRAELDQLPEREQKGILQMEALERWRYALPRKETADAWSYLNHCGVTPALFFRYLCYCADRAIGKKSYGFKTF